MRKLEDIPKRSIFLVPENYFDQLPARIQARTTAATVQRPRRVLTYALRYAVPLAIAAIVFFRIFPMKDDTETILASVETADLVLYLQQEAQLTTEDVIENVDFVQADVEAIENQVYDLPVAADPAVGETDVELNTF